MTVLVPAHAAGPENFHEIAGLRAIKAVKVRTQAQFVEQTRRARAIGVPAAPDSLAVALIADDQLLENPMVEQQFAPLAQRLNGLDQDKIRSARAKTRR